MRTIYLDNSATTPPTDAVIEAMASCMRVGYHNPSSLYADALAAEKQMDACRAAIRSHLGPGQVVFTSGGTEANNLAILGGLASMRAGGRVLFSAGEHASVREACLAAECLGFEAAALPLMTDGTLDLAAAERMLTPDTRLICLMQVNNETGAIQPIEEVVKLKERLCPHAMLHVDAVQGFLRHALPSGGITSVSLSGHKVHGPKGIGALWCKSGTKLQPLTHGGGQERGLRPGTENTPGIAGLFAAINAYPRANTMRSQKVLLWRLLLEGVPSLRVNGPAPDVSKAADHILNVSFFPVRAETMLHALEAEGVLVGNGSACSSRRVQTSRVLKAMGVPAGNAECAVRFSLSPYLSDADIEQAARAAVRCYERLKGFVRR